LLLGFADMTRNAAEAVYRRTMIAQELPPPPPPPRDHEDKDVRQI
jgi:hypothetical protein